MRQDRNSQYLLKTLQGILMILPISKSFQSLKTRLECINVAGFEMPLGQNQNPKSFFGEDYDLMDGPLKLESCLKCFDDKQQQYQDYERRVEEEEKRSKL